jgi:hypothetical protein
MSIKTRCIGIALIVFISCSCGVLRAATVSATATLTVTGGETQPGGVWDSGDLTVEFNGYVESVRYGQYSSPASLASALAAMLVRDYHQYGLWAKAGANGPTVDPTVISLQLTNGDSFGAISFIGPTTSFNFSDTNFSGTVPVAGTPDQTNTSPLITGVSPNIGIAGTTSVILTGQNFGSNPGTITFNGGAASVTFWGNTTITVIAPYGARTGPVVVTAGGVNSNGVLFRIRIAPSCPVN